MWRGWWRGGEVDITQKIDLDLKIKIHKEIFIYIIN